ncbi:MAG: ribonuclease HII [Firmicutes bacterium]|nr:ribonuclease HII [Candidatus Fermentithermobacillaceae bacterium]
MAKNETLKKQLDRARELYEYDETERRIHRFIVGVDEVGRGPMAGPVVAAAVILPPTPRINGIDDSKKLTPKKRERVFDLILDTCLGFGIGIRSSRFVDERGIVEATHSAMRMAVWSLIAQGFRPDLVLVDGYKIRGLPFPQKGLVRGDSISASVASASIIAKVVRDRVMDRFEALYPGYGFEKHKGYCTASHRSVVSSLGPCPIHRRSFAPVSGKVHDAL